MDKTIKERISQLEIQENSYFNIAGEIAKADNSNMYSIDLLCFAAIKRTLSIISAFKHAIETQNYTIAVSLLRFHIDTLLRLYAMSIAKDKNKEVNDILDGKKYNESKLLDGLIDRVPYIKEVYKNASDFVHLSRRHYFLTMPTVDGKSKLIIGASDEHIPDKEFLNIIITFTDINEHILSSLIAWKNQKESYQNRSNT